MKRYLLFIPLISLLPACGPLIIPNEQVGPAYSQASSTERAGGKQRAPLDVPPELKAELEMPMAGEIASRTDDKILSSEYQNAVAGKAISLDAKVYRIEAPKVFSAVVDAMTSMNIPVDSVDSPSGIITSDWIRRGANSTASLGLSIFGDIGDTPVRHRYIVRIYRAKLKDSEATKLEIRVHGQSAVNGSWKNKPFKHKASEQLFVATEEQLQRMQYGITGEKTGDVQPVEITAPKIEQ